MNENLDLTKILEGCPKGTKFYSPLVGKVEFEGISDIFGIILKSQHGNMAYFSKEGHYSNAYEDEECLIFPSKEQRDWSKFVRFWDKPKKERFDPKTLHPFDKVLVRDDSQRRWKGDLFCYINEDREGIKCFCLTYNWHRCIPYNEETKHLVGTSDDCPEYYKWWEE